MWNLLDEDGPFPSDHDRPATAVAPVPPAAGLMPALGSVSRG